MNVRHRFGKRLVTTLGVTAAMWWATPGWANDAPSDAASRTASTSTRPSGAVEVEVTRTRPKKTKHETLRFLKDNRNFIRAQLDRLRHKPKPGQGDGGALDPRYVAYQEMLAGILAAQGETAAAHERADRRTLLARIEALGDLESDLDVMEELLGQQRERLAVLQDDFTGRQETALMILLSGYPGTASIDALTVKDEDGDTHTVPLSDAQREALRQGGLVEIVHRFVEPREQVFEVTLRGDSWPAGDSGFVTLAPARDRLTFLRLDVSTVEDAGGATRIRASTWLYDGALPDHDS